MSKIKIYNGITFDMGTSKVIEHGKVSYVDSSDIAHCGGGGRSSTTTSGFADEFKPEIREMIDTGQGLYDSGQLGKVADFNADQLAAQAAGRTAAANQTGLEGSLLTQANAGVDLSGMRTAASLEAQSALGLSRGAAGRTGNLGGSRSAIDQSNISNSLAAQFATIDQQEQATNFANKSAALGAQGTGAQSLAGIGAGIQQMDQNKADAPYKGLSQLSSIFHGVMPKQTSTEQSGK